MFPVLLGMITGCLEPSTFVCATERGTFVCASGTVCVAYGCALPDEANACVGAVEGAACATPTLSDGGCRAGACLPIVCGDGHAGPREACDDGNTADGDGCAADCRSNEQCGNGITDRRDHELCDDGNQVNDDACRNDCTFPHCGDGRLDPLEACDEGAANANTATATCNTECQLPRCGDGLLQAGEACDDGNLRSGDGCAATCASDETCGNGITDTAQDEACDDRNSNNVDQCRNNCTIPRCGDAVVDVHNGENCDLGAAVNSDEIGTACHTNCQLPRCGDGIVDEHEACDLGDNHNGHDEINGPRCSGDCLSNETCGNGYTDARLGEECDDAQLGLSHDGCTATCKLEPALWTELPSHGLPALETPALAFDSDRQRAVLFGGLGTPGDETWEYDGTTWRRRTTSRGPARLQDSAMAYDPTRKRMVMFGGVRNNDVIDETWEYDGITWTLRTHATRPTARTGHRMVWHQRLQRMVLLGGSNFVRTTMFADFWTYDGTSWTRLTGDAPPGRRTNFGMAYDPDRDRLVVHGGNQWVTSTTGTVLADTWEWDGQDWQQTSVDAGGPRGDVFIGFDPVRRLVLRFGGNGLGYNYRDIWTYDGRWQRVPDVAAPDVFHNEQTVFNTATGQLMVLQPEVTRTATYLFDVTWHAVAPLVRPPGTLRPSSVWDTANDRLLVFGGLNNVASNQLWAHDRTQWEPLATNGGPTARYGHAMATHFDAMGQPEAILFGGTDGTTTYGDTWRLRGQTWTALHPNVAPPARHELALTVTTANGPLMLFGGATATAELLDDLWAFDGTTWHQHAAVGPAGRRGTALAYDVARARLVLFGGMAADGLRDDTWEYDGQTWRQLFLAASPSARSDAVMIYHPGHRRVLLIGGFDGAQARHDVWTFDGTAWQALATPTTMSSRWGATTAYDPRKARVLVFGGMGPGTARADLWQLQFSSSLEPGAACLESSAPDDDGDDLIGCDDPDCAARCRPDCPPLQSCPLASFCGDGTCNAIYEDYLFCPADCEAP